MEFTRDEIETLSDALDAWVNKNLSGEILGMVLDGMVKPDASPEDRERLANERRAKGAAEKRERTETATLLKAKLIGARREIDNRMTEFIGGAR